MPTPRIDVQLGDRTYPVLVEAGLLDRDEAWAGALGDGVVLVVSNTRVAPLYLDRVVGAIGRNDTHAVILPDGEAHKTEASWRQVIDALVRHGARRDATVVALGGGVIGDLAGFAAATWMRGIRLVQVPTTLLAQVDAAIGGKTGFNLAAGKNLVGAFHQPAAVLADTATLDTLDPREYRAGLAEVVKAGAIRDAELLDWLGEHATALGARAHGAVTEMVRRAVAHKAEVVAADEREGGARMLLNFGHTFGHAIETVTGYQRFLHGEAVALGMLMAARLSEDRALAPAGTQNALQGLLAALQLPTRLPADIDVAEVVAAMTLDKKAHAGGLRFVLLENTGQAVVREDLPHDAVAAAVTALQTG